MIFAADMVATSASSILANVVTHPSETVKVRQQLRGASSESESFARVFSSIWRNEGVRSLYRGFGASVLRAIISGGGRQTIYYALKVAAIPEGNTSGALRAGLGVLSGVLAAGVAAPVDMARTRQQSSTGKSASVLHVLRDAYGQGGVAGLYRGSSAVLARQAVLNGSQLATYDRCKDALSRTLGLPIDSLANQALSSAVAGAVTTVAIAPVEMVKTQMQMGRGASMLAAARAVVASSGAAALWRGSFALYLKLAPHSVVVLILTDQFRDLMGIPAIV